MLIDAALLAILVVCVVTDIRSRKIYNKVIGPGLLAALVLQAAEGGWGGILAAGAGFAAGLGILLIPYLLGGMGAGDVKLLALVGAFKGAAFVGMAAVYMALVGGAMALFVLLLRPGWKERVRSLYLAVGSVRSGLGLPTALPSQGGTAPLTYPYGPAIAGGCLLCYLAKGWGMG
ncbi:A24 family peptidase [Paenibacillus sp. S-38]|uniref:A24 family peptidase n=1 Tax=Paenibacillus sp. S-38 TaxID=3416710 RepID=UPI003CF965AA